MALVLLAVAWGSAAQQLDTLFYQLQQTNDVKAQTSVLIAIGRYYQQQNVRGKSIEYFQRAHDQGIAFLGSREQYAILMAMGNQYRDISDYSNAIDAYQQAVAVSSSHKDEIAALQSLSQLQTTVGNFEDAIHSCQLLIPLCEADQRQFIAEAWLRIGLNQQAQKNVVKAFESFGKAIAYAETDQVKQSAILRQAICLMEDQQHYEAQLLLEQLAHSRGGILRLEAEAELLRSRYLEGQAKNITKDAERLCEQAEQQGRNDVLLGLYSTAASIFRAIKDFQQAELYTQKLAKLEIDIKSKDRVWQEAFFQREIEAERRENQIKERLARQQQRESIAKQNQLEQEKQAQLLAYKEQELVLLKREQELQQAQLEQQELERRQIEQQLKLAEQRALAEARTRDADAQRNEAIKQKLLADKAEAEKERLEKAREAASKDAALKQTELESEKSLRKYAYVVFALMLTIGALLIYGFWLSQLAKKELQAKNAEVQIKSEELQTQNEELRQTQEELQAQRDYVEEKNKELALKNETIASSINYARNIQRAILPTREEAYQHFSDYFLLFLPKDIVSGDFYWVGRTDKASVLAVIDCTGHGIPGAFMSMIGYTLMNDIVGLERIWHPPAILEEMHRLIKQVLHQETTHNQDGMDAAVCTIEHLPNGQREVVYAGARIPLYYRMPDGTFGVLDPTKRSIGGEALVDKDFEERRAILPEGTSIYLATDGFIDQSNPQRRKYGKGRFRQLLEELRGTYPEQKQQLFDALKEHQQQEEQRDDITVVCVRI